MNVIYGCIKDFRAVRYKYGSNNNPIYERRRRMVKNGRLGQSEVTLGRYQRLTVFDFSNTTNLEDIWMRHYCRIYRQIDSGWVTIRLNTSFYIYIRKSHECPEVAHFYSKRRDIGGTTGPLHFLSSGSVLMSNLSTLDINFLIPRGTRSSHMFARKYQPTNYSLNGGLARLQRLGNEIYSRIDFFSESLIDYLSLPALLTRGSCSRASLTVFQGDMTEIWNLLVLL
ncbi:hypothetical protein J6590_099018 [Homalodisca vitripennis]|nr:hypothetical protein J6590_099018 [Homalodisca vitripennis]